MPLARIHPAPADMAHTPIPCVHHKAINIANDNRTTPNRLRAGIVLCHKLRMSPDPFPVIPRMACPPLSKIRWVNSPTRDSAFTLCLGQLAPSSPHLLRVTHHPLPRPCVVAVLTARPQPRWPAILVPREGTDRFFGIAASTYLCGTLCHGSTSLKVFPGTPDHHVAGCLSEFWAQKETPRRQWRGERTAQARPMRRGVRSPANGWL